MPPHPGFGGKPAVYQHASCRQPPSDGPKMWALSLLLKNVTGQSRCDWGKRVAEGNAVGRAQVQ